MCLSIFKLNKNIIPNKNIKQLNDNELSMIEILFRQKEMLIHEIFDIMTSEDKISFVNERNIILKNLNLLLIINSKIKLIDNKLFEIKINNILYGSMYQDKYDKKGFKSFDNYYVFGSMSHLDKNITVNPFGKELYVVMKGKDVKEKYYKNHTFIKFINDENSINGNKIDLYCSSQGYSRSVHGTQLNNNEQYKSGLNKDLLPIDINKFKTSQFEYMNSQLDEFYFSDIYSFFRMYDKNYMYLRFVSFDDDEDIYYINGKFKCNNFYLSDKIFIEDFFNYICNTNLIYTLGFQ